VAIAISGLHESLSPNGLHIIRSPEEYNDTLKKADGLSKDRLIMVDKGERLSDDDMNKLKEAGKLYDELNIFEPEKMGPYFASGRIHLLEGEVSTAEDKFIQAINNAPLERNAVTFQAVRSLTGESHFFLAQCLEVESDWPHAYSEVNQAISINPGFANYYYVRARAEVQLKKVKWAKTDLEAALRMEPHFEPARGLLQFINEK